MGKQRRGKGEGGVERLPSGSWRAVVTRRDPATGKRVRTSKAFADKPSALAWLAKQQDAARPASSRTLNDWADTYLDIYRTRQAPGSVRNLRFALGAYIRPYLGRVPLRDITPLAVERWFVALEAAGHSRAALNTAGRMLRKCLSAAVRAELLPTNPFARVRIPAGSPPDTKSFTAEELGRLVAAADRRGGYLGTMVRVWAELGCRPGELFGLRWEDYETGTVRILRAVDPNTRQYRPPKTRRERPIPLSPDTTGRLEIHRHGRTSGVMFGTPQDDKPWWRSNFREGVWVPLCREAGVTGTPNTMRHTCATLLLRSGASLRAVAERLGHADPAMTMRKYAHALPDDQALAAAAWGKILGRVASPRVSPRKRKKQRKPPI